MPLLLVLVRCLRVGQAPLERLARGRFLGQPLLEVRLTRGGGGEFGRRPLLSALVRRLCVGQRLFEGAAGRAGLCQFGAERRFAPRKVRGRRIDLHLPLLPGLFECAGGQAQLSRERVARVADVRKASGELYFLLRETIGECRRL